jgi:nucleotide-binding universal stress UspA family protein
VQYALPNHIAGSLSKTMTAKFYADEWRKATAVAKRLLDRAGMAYKEANLIGEPGTVIANQATRGRFDMVVMGSHGHSALSNLVLGSCASKVLSLSKVPVLLLR